MDLLEDIEKLRELAKLLVDAKRPHYDSDVKEFYQCRRTVLTLCDALETAQKDNRVLAACNATAERMLEKSYFEKKDLVAKLAEAREALRALAEHITRPIEYQERKLALAIVHEALEKTK